MRQAGECWKLLRTARSIGISYQSRGKQTYATKSYTTAFRGFPKVPADRTEVAAVDNRRPLIVPIFTQFIMEALEIAPGYLRKQVMFGMEVDIVGCEKQVSEYGSGYCSRWS
jgi:hypothetical protein